MDKTLQVVVAGQKCEEIPLGIWRTLACLGYVEHKSISSVGFCRGDDGSLIVVLPKAFTQPMARQRIDVDANYKREQVFRLIRVFRQILDDKAFAQSHVDSTRVRGAQGRSVDPVLDVVEAAVRLRADYRRQGRWLPKASVKARNRHSHPVDWSATIKRIQALTDEESIIFPDTIHHRRTRNPNDLFSLIHAYTLRQIFVRTGEKHLLTDLPVPDEAALKPILIRPLSYFRAFRREIFSDRGRMLLACIEAYFGTRTLHIGRPSQADDCLSYTSSFENIWEFILGQIFRPNAESKCRLAPGEWLSWPSQTTTVGITPEADLLVKQPEITIVDAKDYRIFNGSPLLGSRLGFPGDHYKQIIYRTLMASGDSPATANILAFPSLDQKLLFQLNGCHYWPGIKNSPVFEVCVDYDKAIKHWLGDDRLDVASQFQKLLTEIAALRAKMRGMAIV